MTKFITITFAFEDDQNVSIRHNSDKPGAPDELQFVPPFADELIPLPDAIPIPGDPVPFRGAAQNPPPGCPVHRVPWKIVPAGVSKKTGKPYQAFQVCSVQGCDQRPAA